MNATSSNRINVWSDVRTPCDDDVTTSQDTARFAHIKAQAQRGRGGGHAHQGPSVAREALDHMWNAFLSFASRRRQDTCEAEVTPTLRMLEEFWTERVQQGAMRHSSHITEELLMLCVPAMKDVLAANVATATEAFQAAVDGIEGLQLREPWASKLDMWKEQLRLHEEHCEMIELDERVSSIDKGAALATLLELREKGDALMDAVHDAQLELLPTLEPLKFACELAQRRLEAHTTVRCKGGRSVMQHLPSFQCTVASDSSNDNWRPVQSALLYGAWELETRSMHDAYRVLVATKVDCVVGPPDVEDEVAIVQQLCRDVQQRELVQRCDFDRIASIAMRW